MSAKLSAAREIAYDAFIEVMENKQKPQDALEALILQKKAPLKKQDRALAREIVMGSLRWYSKIYWIIQNSASRDLQKSSPEVRTALILGTYQIFYMDRIPDRAAVNESVEYIRQKGQSHAVKFVNGILRSIARRAEYFPKPDKDKQPVDYLSLQFAHPRWIVARWFNRFGFDRMKELLAANNRVPPWSVRINTMKVPGDQIQDFRSRLLKEDRNHTDRCSLRSCLHLKAPPSFEKGGLFDQGYYTIQDEASQLIANLVAPEASQLIVDACCGPGGKLSHIYELGKGEVELVGIEKSESQMERVRENLKRLGQDQAITLITSDFCDYKSKRKPDKILLDAPCSGLGVLRRHPEGKWHKTPTLVAKMAELQKELIRHAIKLLKKGGELIYSVCSFEEEETLEHLVWLQEEFGDTIEVENPAGRIPDYYGRFVTREKVLLIYSGNKNLMDGFGAFVIKKH